VVVLADGPDLDPRAVERVLDRDEPVVAASYDGTRSHPVALTRSAWGNVPDEGGRAVEPVLVDCSDLRPPGDVDVRR
jgi:CTP:molybdopterin cytidylyltransferase MocA